MKEQLIALTQAGLMIVPRPYLELANQLNCSEEEVQNVMSTMLHSGEVRRIAAVPNHYRMGYVANGMTVWDVADDLVDQLGEQVGQLECVSHCYRRPRHPGVWNYNLFAMVHGANREECYTHAEKIREILGPSCRAHEVLFSKRILKKTGFRQSQRKE